MERTRAAGIICYRPKDDAVLLLRHTPGQHWGFPKGHRDDTDATDIACALRELREEIGPARVVLVPGFREELCYTVPKSSRREAYPKVVVCFLGLWPDGVEPQLSREHDAFAFVGASKLAPHLPFENMLPLLERAVAFAKRLAL